MAMNKKKYWLYAATVVLFLSAAAYFSSTREANIKLVGVATLVVHPGLEDIEKGMKEALTQEGYVEGETIRYLHRNASGQIQMASSIAREVASHSPDVIVAITTPIAQAVANDRSTPIVFAAVTDPVGAGLVASLDVGEQDVTGTSDAWPYQDQLKLIREITPDVRKLGVLYNPGEAPSQYGMQRLRKFAPEIGLELVEVPVNSVVEIYPAAQNLIGRVDALLVTSDNTVISGLAALLKISFDSKVPLFVGESGSVQKGGLAAVSVGYYELGRETGKLVARVLNGETGIPTHVARGSQIHVNLKSAKMLDISIPSSVLERATAVYEEIQP